MTPKVAAVLACLLVGLLLPPPAWGASAEPAQQPFGIVAAKTTEGHEAPTRGPRYGVPPLPWARLAGGTALVIALACFAVYGLKRLDRGGRMGRHGYMDVLETQRLGRKAQLFLVRVAGRIVLLAATGENVTQLTEFDEQELPVADTAQDAPVLLRFGSLVKRLAGAQK